MLRTLLLSLLIAAPLCGQQQHQVRIQNNYEREIKTLEVGTVSFENIPPGAQTEYQLINPGRATIQGSLEGKGNIYLDGTLVIPRTAAQMWTLTLQADRQFSVAADSSPTPQRSRREAAEPKNLLRLRFQNWSRNQVVGVRVDEVDMQGIPAGSTTSYVWVPSGVLDVKVDIEGPNLLKEQIFIPNEAHRRYTLRLDRTGALVLIQE